MAPNHYKGLLKKVLLGFITEQDPVLAMLEWVAHQMMLIEAEAKVGAEKGKHCSDRKTYFSGARVRRIRCGSCGDKQVEVPWARSGSGFTLLFELLVLSLSREMSVAAVAELTFEHANRLWRILKHYVERARRTVDLSGFHQLGIDEFSIRKGHVYMTSFGDLM